MCVGAGERNWKQSVGLLQTGGCCRILIELPISPPRPFVSVLIIELASPLSAGDTYFISVE